MERTGSQLTLLEAARIVARGGNLEEDLKALAGHVLAATGARATAIYLLDPIGQSLVPAAAAGITPERLADAPSITVGEGNELAAQVAHERRAITATGDIVGLFSGTSQAGGSLIGLPLMAGDADGREEVEGVLVTSYTGEPPDANAAEDPLFALADLCAVAIRKARLTNALTERSEWIERLASTDALTGLANRPTFERMLELEIARATRQATQVSVVLFDVDDMAGLNEREGQPAGDAVLRHIASLLADQVRLIDTIARLGGDEFGLIAPGGGGDVVAGRVRDAAAQLKTPGGVPISVRAAVAVFPADGGTTTELLDAASAELEEARA